MSGCYLAVVALAGRLSPRIAIGAIVALHAAFMLAPPLLSADVFGYIDWARMGALHGLDPYSHGSLSLTHDEVFRYMTWHTHLSSPYGPLFTVASYALAPLGVAASFWVLKAVAALASLAVVGLTWACARRLGCAPLPAAVFVGLNPLVLVWAVGGAHNDLIAMAMAMVAIYLALGARERAGAAVSVLAAAVKASTAVVLPFLIVGARRRRDALLGAVAGAALVAVTALIAFGGDAAGFVKSNGDQQNLVANSSVPNQVGSWLGLGGITPALRTLALAGVVVVVAWLLVRTWRGGDWVNAAGWATLALLIGSAWLMPWYVAWLLPLAALAASGRLTLATLAFCGYMVVMRTPL
jgi:alpha-1,6-mannosyltransferase